MAPEEAVLSRAGSLHADLPVAAASAVLGSWTRLHGLVALEVFGHLHWLGDTTRIGDDQLVALVADIVGPATG